MARRISAYLTILLFLIAVSGLQINVHYCGDEQMFMALNGINVHNFADAADDCCHGGKDKCSGCHDKAHFVQVKSHFARGQTIDLTPNLYHANWFHGDLPALWQPIIWSALTCETESSSHYYIPPAPPGFCVEPHGLRAPPRGGQHALQGRP